VTLFPTCAATQPTSVPQRVPEDVVHVRGACGQEELNRLDSDAEEGAGQERLDVGAPGGPVFAVQEPRFRPLQPFDALPGTLEVDFKVPDHLLDVPDLDLRIPLAVGAFR